MPYVLQDGGIIRIETGPIIDLFGRTLNASGLRAAYVLTLPDAYINKQISQVEVFCPTRNGTLTNIGKVSLQACVSGTPTLTSIEEQTFTPNSNNTSFASITGWTSSAIWSANQMALVFRNADGSPGSNNYGIPSQPIPYGVPPGSSCMWYNGSSWIERKSGIPPVVVKFTDGSRYGPAYLRPSWGNQGTTPMEIYGARAWGAKFKAPCACEVLRVETLVRLIGSVGSAGSMQLSVLDQTGGGKVERETSPSYSFDTTSQNYLAFDPTDTSKCRFKEGDVIGVLIHQPSGSGGDSSNRYLIAYSNLAFTVPTGNLADSVPCGITGQRATDYPTLSTLAIEASSDQAIPWLGIELRPLQSRIYSFNGGFNG